MASRTDAQRLEIVEAFVFRLRRVTAHSLCQRLDMLEFWAGGGFSLYREQGATGMRLMLPPEEPAESLAARLRPLILSRESVYYATALKCLRELLLDDHPDLAQVVKDLSATWRKVDPAHSELTYSVAASSSDATVHPRVEMHNNDLALSWLYGDLVHADTQRQESGRPFGLSVRYQAGAVKLAQLTITGLDTLDVIRYVAGLQVIPFDHDLFLAEVVVPKDTVNKAGTLRAAPVGTPVPGPDDALEGWEEWTADSLDGDHDLHQAMWMPWGNETGRTTS